MPQTYSFPQFRLNERLKYFEENIESVRRVDHINALHTQWHALLQPLQKHRCKHWREVNDLIQRKTCKNIQINLIFGGEKRLLQYLQNP